MNVFILCTGRTGSTTFVRACHHISNYSVAHESLTRLVGAQRLAYPANHIEADNRLAWFLGRLDKAFGQDAFYVHLRREEQATARSFLKRYNHVSGIMHAYRHGILMGYSAEFSPIDIARDYYQTVTANIDFFLRDKPHQMTFWLENATEDFPRFWQAIEAEGDLDAALAEWQQLYNAADKTQTT